MQHAADGVERFEAHDGFGAIVSDLISLPEHLKASIRLIERRIAQEVIICDHDSSNIIVLDDVTPQYVKASTALKSCSANLGHCSSCSTPGLSRADDPALGRRQARGCIGNPTFCAAKRR
jgi:hypothetical protein